MRGEYIRPLTIFLFILYKICIEFDYFPHLPGDVSHDLYTGSVLWENKKGNWERNRQLFDNIFATYSDLFLHYATLADFFVERKLGLKSFNNIIFLLLFLGNWGLKPWIDRLPHFLILQSVQLLNDGQLSK